MKQISVQALALLVCLTARSAGAQTGEFRLTAGLGSGTWAGGLSTSPVTMASFSFVKSAFSMGPEVLFISEDERVFGLGVVARLRLGSGRLRPYLTGGLGGNFWRREGFVTAGLFSGSLGAGVSLIRGSPLEVTLEARLHKNLQRYGAGGNWDFITLVAGARLGW